MTSVYQALVGILLAVVYIAYHTGRWSCTPPSIVSDTLDDTYDYIVVGGGTAGSVLAARLAEDGNQKVLLLEAGDHHDDNFMFRHPSQFIHLFHSEHDWNYYTEPQLQSGRGLNDGRHYWPRGRVLGGSSMINLMQYARGSPHDFDEWSRHGCEGWSYTDVLPFFLKSEDIRIDELRSSKYHSTGGPIAVSGGIVTPLAELYAQAAEQLGFTITDYNGADQEGFGYVQLNVRNGVRSSTAIELLGGTAHRHNLHIAVNSFAVKIEITSKRATGVHFIRHERKQFVRATKEVIVSAGSVNSPQLLMLSGIGPKEQLDELNISTIADLPVGANLADHMQILIPNRINVSYSITPALIDSWSTRLQYYMLGTGPLAATGTELTGFVYLDESKRGNSYPEIQLILSSRLFDIDNDLFNLKQESKKGYFANSSSDNGFMFSVMLTHPSSKGTIKLRSTDPFDPPIIDPRYLTDKQDVNDFIGGIRIWEKFVQTPTMKLLGADVERLNISVCGGHEFRSEEYWECFVRHYAVTVYHHCGTCRMGADSDPAAVVDPQLRVKGVRGLRVVDASVFPDVVSGNINAAIVMVAEKAADIIRGVDSVAEYRKRFT